jgi:hypothetical protein
MLHDLVESLSLAEKEGLASQPFQRLDAFMFFICKLYEDGGRNVLCLQLLMPPDTPLLNLNPTNKNR